MHGNNEKAIRTVALAGNDETEKLQKRGYFADRL